MKRVFVSKDNIAAAVVFSLDPNWEAPADLKAFTEVNLDDNIPVQPGFTPTQAQIPQVDAFRLKALER